jgi:uroporphyrinogen decarboxylase
MNSRERVHAVLERITPDRVPRFEVWIDGLFYELGVSDPYSAYAELGQDAVLMPSQTPSESNAWKDGVDEFGRVWKNGMYFNGAVELLDDLKRYTPPTSYAERFFDTQRVTAIRTKYPDHCLFYGTHIGPFMGAYMAMGLERMFAIYRKDPQFIHAVMETRLAWALAIFQRAVELGAEVIIMGDDSAHRGGPMISPKMWRELVLPYHQRLVRELSVPVIWHTDGKIEKLLPFAVEAGFAGVHGIETLAGNKLDEIKRDYSDKLILMGNVDINLFFEPNIEAVRADVRRSYEQGGKSGYMLSSCNSIYPGMNPEAVCEFFRCQVEFGGE